METQQEGVLFPEMPLHQMLTIGSEHEKLPRLSRTSSQQHREELAKVVRSAGFPLTPHTPGKNLENSFWGRDQRCSEFLA